MAVNFLNFQIVAVANETPAQGLSTVVDQPIAHQVTGAGFATSVQLTPSTTPPVSKVASGLRTLSAGVLTEDLTNLAGPASSTVTFNTLKLVYVEIFCPATNTQPVTFTNGASNGYNIFGVAASKVSIPPGGCLSLYLGAGGLTVDATHKTFDVSSAMAAATYQIVMGAG